MSKALCLGLALPLAKKRKLQSGTGQNLLTKFVAGRAKKRGRQLAHVETP